MTTVGEASVQDDEWFGEGSAFDFGEDLAAALFALAGTTRIDINPQGGNRLAGSDRGPQGPGG